MRHFQPLFQNVIKDWYLRRVLKMYHHAANWTWLLYLFSKLKVSNSTNKGFLIEFMEGCHPSFTYCANAQPFIKSYNTNLWQNWILSGGRKIFSLEKCWSLITEQNSRIMEHVMGQCKPIFQLVRGSPQASAFLKGRFRWLALHRVEPLTKKVMESWYRWPAVIFGCYPHSPDTCIQELLIIKARE